MKKLMVSTIIVLPLLILTIMLISGAIMSLSMHIYVEKLELKKLDAIILIMDDDENPPTYNLGPEVTILPMQATNKSLKYLSGDESLIKVDDEGLIKAVSFGETYVTVASKDNENATAQRKVIITDDKVHFLRARGEVEYDMYIDEAEQLRVDVLPAEADNTLVHWTSDDPNIVKVGADGMINSVGVGTTKVVATSDDNPEAKIEFEIRVNKKLTGLNFDSGLVTTVDKTMNFPTEISPIPSEVKLEDLALTYTSSDIETATVNNEGKITFLKPGSVTITLTATDFRGTKATKSKQYISTLGYFTDPIFITKTLSWSDCSELDEGDELPTSWLNSEQLEGTFNGIKSITCKKDGEDVIDNLIYFDNETKTFKFGNSVDCTEFIDVEIDATYYDFKTNRLVETSDLGANTGKFQIKKNATESGRDAVVKLNDVELKKTEANEIKIANIGDTIDLIISNNEADPIEINNGYVTSTITDLENGEKKFSITAKSVCKDRVMNLYVGVSKFELKLTIEAMADTITITTTNEFNIENGKTYKTLLSSLNFNAVASRSKNDFDVTNPTIEYKIGDDEDFETSVDGNIEVAVTEEVNVTLKCGTAEMTFTLRKVTLDNYTLKFSVPTTNSGIVQCGEVTVSENSQNYTEYLPSNIQASLFIDVSIDEEIIGGLGTDEEFETMFEVTTPEDTSWEVQHNALNKRIVITFVGDQEFNKDIKIANNGHELNLQVIKVNLKDIQFIGFRQDYPNITTDKYMGYQQVRVFAKNSYYNGAVVPYFRMQYKATSSYVEEKQTAPEVITWKFTRMVKDEAVESFTQIGYEVNYNGVRYTIEKDETLNEYVLKDATGKIVSSKNDNTSGIIWVDPFTESEAGYVRIYFGNFAGLEESDVQNDYFGNFGEEANYKAPETPLPDDPTEEDRNFNFTDNSFAFLKIEAGDGSKEGKNCHFNFNVLDDTTLVNVFNADGYYKNQNIVLHTSLYGDGEVDNPDDYKGLFLDKKDNLDKEIIYGNGNSLNYKVKNTKDAAVRLHRVYNTTIKGDNPSSEISQSKQFLRFHFEYSYYNNIEYIYKCRPYTDGEGGRVFFKNTVVRGASKSPIRLEQAGETAYLENMVLVECGGAISLEKARNETLYVKGSLDVLNYNNSTGLVALAGGGESSSYLIPSVMVMIMNYVEWFGSTPKTDSINELMVNLLMYVDSTTLWSYNVSYWDDNTHQYAQCNPSMNKTNPMQLPYGVVTRIDGWGILDPWSYQYTQSMDGAKFTLGSNRTTIASATRDMSKLFNPERYIRLLCQYKTKTNENGIDVFEPNEKHIQWHMDLAHRDITLLKSRTTKF